MSRNRESLLRHPISGVQGRGDTRLPETTTFGRDSQCLRTENVKNCRLEKTPEQDVPQLTS